MYTFRVAESLGTKWMNNFVHFYGLAALLIFNIPNTYSCENHFRAAFFRFLWTDVCIFSWNPVLTWGFQRLLSFRMTTDQNTRNGWTLIAPWMIAKRRLGIGDGSSGWSSETQSFGSYQHKNHGLKVWWWWWWLLSLWLDDDEDGGDCFMNHYKDPY